MNRHIPTYRNATPTPALVPNAETDKGEAIFAYITQAEIDQANRERGGDADHGFPPTKEIADSISLDLPVHTVPLLSDPRGFGDWLAPVIDELDRQSRHRESPDETAIVRLYYRRVSDGAWAWFDPRIGG